MRFAPPKSAPPETRRCTKDTEKELQEDYHLSGWVIKPIQPDITLLRQCLSTAPRRCSSATERTSGCQLIVHFNRITNSLKYKRTSSEGSIKSRTYSKDSGVDGLTESGIDNMAESGIDNMAADNRGKMSEEEEFSDISESNDGSLDNEAELVGLTVSEPEFSDLESRDLESRDTSLSALGTPPLDHEELVEQETSQSGRSSNINTSNCNINTSNCNINSTNPDKNALLPRNKRRAKREHQIPHPVTPEIPENPAPSKQQQVWSRSRKLERHSTSPSLCSYSEVCSQVYEVKKDPDQFLNNPFENVLHANRPPYRNEKRRASNSFKSSCSIPSFSTPSQALLLIGMKPSNKPSPHDSNKNLGRPPNRKLLHKPPPLMNKARVNGHVNRNNMLELPALSVNGVGDLVIRKKQIISG